MDKTAATKKTLNELSQKILVAYRSDPNVIEQLSNALLSHDPAKIRHSFQQDIGVKLTAEDLSVIEKNWVNEQQIEAQIAACT